MAFQPGQSGNPLGRPKRIDPRSQELEEFCKANRDNIRVVGEIALEEATKKREPWAIRLCMEYFYPKPGTFVSVTKEETKEINVNFLNALPYEDQQAFLKLWMRAKKGIPAFSQVNEAKDCSLDPSGLVEDPEKPHTILDYT